MIDSNIAANAGLLELFLPLIQLVIWAAIIPCWFAASKAGKSGFVSLFLLLPIFGPLVYLMLMAFGRWPAIEQGEA